MRRRWTLLWRVSLGSILIVLGIVLIPLPGPGLAVIIAGLAVMASEVPVADRIMHELKRKTCQVERAVRNRF